MSIGVPKASRVRKPKRGQGLKSFAFAQGNFAFKDGVPGSFVGLERIVTAFFAFHPVPLKAWRNNNLSNCSC